MYLQKYFFRLSIVVIFLLITVLGFFIRSTNAATDQVQTLNSQIIQTNSTLLRTSFRSRSGVVAKLKNLSAKRKTLLLNQARKDPQTFLRNILPLSVRNSLPADIQPLLEKETTFKGSIDVIHVDYADRKRTGELYTIQSRGKNYTLRSSKITLRDFTKKQVSIKGYALGSEMVVQDVQSLAPVPPSPNGSLGEQKTLVMLVNFDTKPEKPVTVNQIKGMMFTNPVSINSYYRENSFNQTSFSGDVLGWYTLTDDGTNCEESFIDWTNQVEAKATQQGIDISSYPRHFFAFILPRSCGWGGLGNIGTTPSRAWLFGSDYISDKNAYTHELGHNLGANHASGKDCSPNQVGGTCTVSEYGESFDVMGTGFYHFNAPHKIQVGWMPTRVETVTQNGTYTISPLEVNQGTTQILKIAKPGVNDTYYVEYRQLLGYDELLPAEAVRGALVHIWNSYNTELVDSTPGSPLGFRDAALQDGAEINDYENVIKIKQISHNGSGVTVQITLTPIVPTVSPPLLSSWNLQPNLPLPLMSHTMTAVNGRMYVIGGSSSGVKQQNVYSGQIGTDGNISAWTRLASMTYLEPIADHTVVVKNNKLYVIGGNAQDVMGKVSMTNVNTDGSLTPWNSMAPLPKAVVGHASVVEGDKMYVLGGVSSSQPPYVDVYMSTIGATGNVGSWSETTPLPKGLRYLTAFSSGGYLYAVGGDTSVEAQSLVYSAKIQPNGTLGQWNNIVSAALPEKRYHHGSFVANGNLYVIGGRLNEATGNDRSDIFVSQVVSNGNLGPWQKEVSLPKHLSSFALSFTGERVYLSGGMTDFSSTLGRDDVSMVRILGTPSCPRFVCDINNDGKEDSQDGLFITGCWSKQGNLGLCARGDTDCNGKINVVDIQKLTSACPKIFAP